MTREIAILLFDDVEVLDFAGPFEVFTTASRVHARLAGSGSAPPFAVQLVARQATVHSRAGLTVLAAAGFDEAKQPDVLIVPGGVVDAAMVCTETLAWIRRSAADAECVASVCTGAFLLAAAGVMNDGEVTTHWEDVPALRQAFPALTVRDDLRWVDRGRIVSSAGISAGIDMCLHLVARFAGLPLAEATTRQMDYRWSADPLLASQPPAQSSRPSS